MLDPGLRFEGFDTEDWTRLVELLRGRPGSVQEAGLIVVHDQGRVRKALRTQGAGTLRPGEPWPQSLAGVARRETVGWVVALEAGALDAWMDWVGEHAGRDHDLLDQLLVAWEGLRDLAVRGRLVTWPTAASSVPVPRRATILGAMGLVCPPGQSVLIAAWDGGRLWTSLAVRTSGSGIDWMMGPESFRVSVEAAGPNPEALWACLLDGVRDRMGPVALGIAADRTQWDQIAGSTEMGAWAKAVVTGRIIVEPVGRGLAVPLAADASRMVVSTVRAVMGWRNDVGMRDGGAKDVARLWRLAEGLWSLRR